MCTTTGARGPNMAEQRESFHDYSCPEEDAVTFYGYGRDDEIVPSAHRRPGTPSTALVRGSPRRSSLKVAGQGRRASISYTGEVTVRLRGDTVVTRRRSISFAETNKMCLVKQVEPLQSLTDEILWTTSADHERTKQEAKQVIRAFILRKKNKSNKGQGAKRLMNGLLCGQNVGHGEEEEEEDEELCVRGFERYLRNHSHNNTIQRSRSLVLRIQESQKKMGLWTNGSDSDETLYRVYSHMTAEAARKARQMGAQDYAHVRQDHRMTKRLMNRRNGVMYSRRSSI